MTEVTLQIIASLKLLGVTCFATLYGLGGMFLRQQLRRISGSILYVSMVCGFSLWTGSFSYWYLLCLPLIYGALSLGYGASNTWVKVFKRGYTGLAYSIAALPIAVVTSNWTMFALHTALCVSVSITLGVLNPTSARNEESLIGATITLLPIMMA